MMAPWRGGLFALIPRQGPPQCALPLGIACIGTPAVGIRLESAFSIGLSRQSGDVLESAPNSFGNSGEVGGAQRGRLRDRGAYDRNAELVCLDLQ